MPFHVGFVVGRMVMGQDMQEHASNENYELSLNDNCLAVTMWTVFMHYLHISHKHCIVL